MAEKVTLDGTLNLSTLFPGRDVRFLSTSPVLRVSEQGVVTPLKLGVGVVKAFDGANELKSLSIQVIKGFSKTTERETVFAVTYMGGSRIRFAWDNLNLNKPIVCGGKVMSATGVIVATKTGTHLAYIPIVDAGRASAIIEMDGLYVSGSGEIAFELWSAIKVGDSEPEVGNLQKVVKAFVPRRNKLEISHLSITDMVLRVKWNSVILRREFVLRITDAATNLAKALVSIGLDSELSWEGELPEGIYTLSVTDSTTLDCVVSERFTVYAKGSFIQ